MSVVKELRVGVYCPGLAGQLTSRVLAVECLKDGRLKKPVKFKVAEIPLESMETEGQKTALREAACHFLIRSWGTTEVEARLIWPVETGNGPQVRFEGGRSRTAGGLKNFWNETPSPSDALEGLKRLMRSLPEAEFWEWLDDAEEVRVHYKLNGKASTRKGCKTT